jgi:hypothetical protein
MLKSFLSGIALVLAFTYPGMAQTADGETLAVEDVCANAGLTGKALGLCNAYCEAMDCDSGSPQASEAACLRILSQLDTYILDGDLPLCDDQDGDGVANGFDNCPDVFNPGQEDTGDRPGVGDACDPDGCRCLGLGTNPVSVAELLEDASAFPSGPYTTTSCVSDSNTTEYVAAIPAVETHFQFFRNDTPACGIRNRQNGSTIYGAGGSVSASNAFLCKLAIEEVQAADPLGICGP